LNRSRAHGEETTADTNKKDERNTTLLPASRSRRCSAAQARTPTSKQERTQRNTTQPTKTLLLQLGLLLLQLCLLLLRRLLRQEVRVACVASRILQTKQSTISET
jgi:hypothetical protein